MQTNYLHMGGGADGMVMPVMDVWGFKYRVAKMYGEEEWYVKMKLRGETKEFEIFVLEGMSGDEVMEKLLARYKIS